MSVPENEIPVRTVIQTLPNVSVAGGASRTSPFISVPVGTNRINALVNGSAWPANTQITVLTELTVDNGATILTSAKSTHTNVASPSNIYGTGYQFGPGGNTDPNLRIRATVTVLSAGSITLVGDVGIT
jgi:hypothetical protein